MFLPTDIVFQQRMEQFTLNRRYITFTYNTKDMFQD